MYLLQLFISIWMVSGLCNGHYNCLTWTSDNTDISLICRLHNFLLPVSFIDPNEKEQAKCTFNTSLPNCLHHHKHGNIRADMQMHKVVFVIKGFEKLNVNGEWACTQGKKRFTTIVSTNKGLLETTNLYIDGFIQSANNTGLKCFSCREPEWKSAEFLINNRTEDSVRYDEISKQCFHSKGLCHPNSCSCSKYGDEFIRIFPVDIHRHRYETTFSCEMHFVDFMMSLSFLKIASVIFNGTDFIPLTTITKITKAAEMDKEVNSSRNETKTTVPTEIEVGPTYQFHVKWVAVVCIIVIMFVVIAFIIVCLYKKNLTKREKHAESAVNVERETETLPLSGGKYDNYVKDVEKESVTSILNGNKDDKCVNDVEKGSLVQLKENVTDDKEIEDSRNVSLHDMQNALNEEEVLCSNLSQHSQVAITNKGPASIEVISEFDKVSLQGHLISGIAVTEDDIVLLSDCRKPNVLFFNKTGKYLSTTAVQYTPWDIVAIPNAKTAVASSKSNPFIQFINTQSYKLKTSKKLEGSLGGGIACSRGNIFVGGMNRIFVLDHEGSHLRTVLNKFYKNIFIQYLSFNDGEFYFTDSEYNSVVCMKQTGVECTPIKSSLLQTPVKVVFDRQGEMYILGNGSDNIVRATNLGEVIEPPLTNDNRINCPWNLCFGNDYRYLYISNQNGTSVILCKLVISNTDRTCTS